MVMLARAVAFGGLFGIWYAFGDTAALITVGAVFASAIVWRLLRRF
jgi:hypothetical protein